MNPAGPRHVPVLGREAVEMLSPRDGPVNAADMLPLWVRALAT